jgi:hypothetical protein
MAKLQEAINHKKMTPFPRVASKFSPVFFLRAQWGFGSAFLPFLPFFEEKRGEICVVTLSLRTDRVGVPFTLVALSFPNVKVRKEVKTFQTNYAAESPVGRQRC